MKNNLISRHRLEIAYIEYTYEQHKKGVPMSVPDPIREMIRNQPAMDAVEVVHSWWEDCSNGWSCGNCHYDTSKEYPYCPWCGARMDGRREDGNA